MHQILIAAAALGVQNGTGQEEGAAIGQAIIVTASRDPVAAEAAPVSATVLDEETLDALALPQVSDLVRLVPGVTVASTGPKGTQTQLRIRGAEANHTLLFVDGIKLNDPAAANEARFELLASDALSRIEVVRGPQSALWGSEALGGVVAIETADPMSGGGFGALAEYGSLDSYRLSAEGAKRFGKMGIAGALGFLGSQGIDSVGDGSERDGFRSRTATLKAVYAPLPSAELGLVGHRIVGTSEFDGFTPFGRRANTLDETDNEIVALRGWGSAEWDGWSLSADAGILDGENRNRLGEAPLNSSFGKRLALGAQMSRAIGAHRLTGAVEYEEEDFRTAGNAVFGAPDQQRSRALTAFVGQWRAQWLPGLITDIAVRHDDFSAFGDATTVRAGAVFSPAPAWTVHAAYGEGIAQPDFYELYGFYPGSFLGNPDLGPERQKGWEAGVRWRGAGASAGITGFSYRLRDEIVGTFDPVTFLSSAENAEGASRRRGIEAEASYRFPGFAELFLNYTYLDADEPRVGGGPAVRETRRPKHSANAALTGAAGRFSWGASLAYVGERTDRDFDFFPAPVVTLGDYLLASLKLGYRVTEAVEAYARVENGLGADYQDVFGYDTAGRTVYAGLRLRLGD